jgi:phosphoenolpyruvate synthase/pyruvate phosphate dikinase
MADKTEKFIQSEEGGVTKVKVQEDLVKNPTLSDDQAVEIAKLLMELEEEMTKPQDFEWGIEKGSECVCVCVCEIYLEGGEPRNFPSLRFISLPELCLQNSNKVLGHV